jgi:hypothetical protein
MYNTTKRPEVSRAHAPARHPTLRGGEVRTWFFASSAALGMLTAALGVLMTACTTAASGDMTPRSDPASSKTFPVAAEAGYRPDIDPRGFVPEIDNPLFTLKPGTIFRLQGKTEDGVERETITVTKRTKEILGVTTTVVKDVVRVKGEIAEFTYDWYAQDREGNVWYFGEETAEYEDGKIVSREGSWEAGVDGALPGIVMNTDPKVTDSYRQEYYRGEAEDMYWVVAVGERKSVAYDDFDDVVQTLEWTPLEPKIIVEKVYAPGVGLIAERALAGPQEEVELLRVIHPQR